MDPKVKEALEALASGNASLFACLWNSYREKSFAYSNKEEGDPFNPIYVTAAAMLGRKPNAKKKKNPLFKKTA